MQLETTLSARASRSRLSRLTKSDILLSAKTVLVNFEYEQPGLGRPRKSLFQSLNSSYIHVVLLSIIRESSRRRFDN
jgi:hypothetical protein